MRHTRSHTGNRRSHHALKGMAIVTDKESGAVRLPHRVDEATGLYRGKQIFTPKVKNTDKHGAGEQKGVQPKLPKADRHDAREHAEQTQGAGKGIMGKLMNNARPKSRSGMGGQAGKSGSK
jgi:large subunit ribosomal protein L32